MESLSTGLEVISSAPPQSDQSGTTITHPVTTRNAAGAVDAISSDTQHIDDLSLPTTPKSSFSQVKQETAESSQADKAVVDSETWLSPPPPASAQSLKQESLRNGAAVPPGSTTSTPGKARRVRRPEQTLTSSREFAPLPVEPVMARTGRDTSSKRIDRKSKTDAISALNGAKGDAKLSGSKAVPTPSHHPSRKPLGPLARTQKPLPLYTPPPATPNGSATEATPTHSIPTHHNTPRQAPPRRRARLFDLEEAPTFYPTAEQFADPLKFIQWVGEPSGGNGKAYGIVKIVPPEGWSPPFVLDQERFRFRTRVQRLNSLSADARASLNYQEQLQRFHAQQGQARVSIPIVDRRPVDLYQLKLVVGAHGGYDSVARNRKWSEVTRKLGYDEKESCHLAGQIKAAYSRIIYPFERFLQANRETGKRANGSAADDYHAAGSSKDGASPDANGSMTGDDTLMDDADSSSMGTRRRSARRRTDPRDAPVILTARASTRQQHQQQPTPPPEGTSGDFYVVPGAEEQMCEICLRGDDGPSMLLCDECNRGYHMFCLDPPLTAVPKSEWYCPACLVGTGNDYGFDDGETHSLSSFWARAEAFRKAWWQQRSVAADGGEALWKPEDGTPNGLTRAVHGTDLNISEDSVEREFWRLVHSPDETVEVEYGADVHSTTHGSALPTLETHPRSPYSRDGWNLNNLPILNGSLLRYIKSDISGMTVPWIYVGMIFSTFCWHNEDHYTYSINYQHFGDTKTWYGVPGSDAHKLENALRKAAPDLFEQSPDLLFQLVTMMSPDKLKKEGVQVYAVDQRANEFVITYPKAYHSGFNHGFNLNEAVNFALPDWIELDLECVRRYQQYNRFPVFSHDELIATVYQHSQTVDTAKWLQGPLREMIEREMKKRNAVRALVPPVQEASEESDLPEPQYQCAHCNVFCYLGQITSAKADGVACLDHGHEVCRSDPSQWTMRLRFSDEQLAGMLSKTAERASVPSNWQARLLKVIMNSARPPLRTLRGLLHEGEKIAYPIAELDQLHEFVEKANKWVDEATAFIARRHQKRAGVATKDILGPRRSAGRRRDSSRVPEDEEAAATAAASEENEQLGEPNKIYELLAEAELLPFDAPEIAALQGVVEHMEEFKHRASSLLTRIDRGDDPRIAECEEVLSMGSTLSVKLHELDTLQMYVNRRKWLTDVSEMSESFFNLDEVQGYIDDGLALGVPRDDKRMQMLRERIEAGLQWRRTAESVLEPCTRSAKQSCRWTLSDVDLLTKASYKVAIVPELLIKVDSLLKQVKELTKQSAALLEVLLPKDGSSPSTATYMEAERFLQQAAAISVIIEGEQDVWYQVRKQARWETRYAQAAPSASDGRVPQPTSAHHHHAPGPAHPSSSVPASQQYAHRYRYDDYYQRPSLPSPMRGLPPPPPPPQSASAQYSQSRPQHGFEYARNASPIDSKTAMDLDVSPQAPGSPGDDARKRKRGKRARFVFQEEVGIFVPVNGERIYCLCRRGEMGKMISCDRCTLWFHNECVHIDDGSDIGAERWICPLCCVKTERRYPFAEVRVKEMGVTDPNLWLDVRATLRSTRLPVSKLQHWTVDATKRIVLHLESFFPATLPSASDRGEDAVKRQRSNDDEAFGGRLRSGSHGSASSGPSTSNANAVGSVSHLPAWNDVRARVTPTHRTPTAEENHARAQREAEERHRQGMANLYSRGVTDAMIQKWYIGWNGRELVFPRYDGNNVCRELGLGPRIELAPDDLDGSQLIHAMLESEAKEIARRRGPTATTAASTITRSPVAERVLPPLLVPSSSSTRPLAPRPSVLPRPVAAAATALMPVRSPLPPQRNATQTDDFGQRRELTGLPLSRGTASPASGRDGAPLPPIMRAAAAEKATSSPRSAAIVPAKSDGTSKPSRSAFSVSAIPPFRGKSSASNSPTSNEGGSSVNTPAAATATSALPPAPSAAAVAAASGIRAAVPLPAQIHNAAPPRPVKVTIPVAPTRPRSPPPPQAPLPSSRLPSSSSFGPSYPSTLARQAGGGQTRMGQPSPSSRMVSLPLAPPPRAPSPSSYYGAHPSYSRGGRGDERSSNGGSHARSSHAAPPPTRPMHYSNNLQQSSPRLSASYAGGSSASATRSPGMAPRHPLNIEVLPSPTGNTASGSSLSSPASQYRSIAASYTGGHAGRASASPRLHPLLPASPRTAEGGAMRSPHASVPPPPPPMPPAHQQHSAPSKTDELRSLARRMRPGASEEEIEAMVRSALS